MARPDLSGKWTLEKNEKFEEFLGANGAPWIARKMANKAGCDLEIEQKDDKITTVTKGKVKTSTNEMEIGKAMEEKMNDGSTMLITPSWEGDKLFLNYEVKEGSAKPQKQYRYIDGDKLIMEMTVGDITAKRIFMKSS